MSTITNNSNAGLPDLDSLRDVANDLFRSLPNEFPKEISLDPTAHPKANRLADSLYNGYAGAGQQSGTDGFSIAQPPTSLPDPHFSANQPASIPFSGSGFSPSAAGLQGIPGIGTAPSHEVGTPYPAVTSPALSNGNQQQNTGGNAADNAIPGLSYVGNRQLPQSVAGSGKSPSAVHHGNEVNIANPQTSLDDPHFAGGGKIPASVAGSGKSPSLVQPAGTHHLPYSDQSFDKELLQALQAIPVFGNQPQLPGFDAGLINPNYYFLNGHQPLPAANSVIGAQHHHAGGDLQRPPFDVNLVRRDFTILQEKVNGKPLIWLDNAATTQKPRQVIERVSYFYEHENSNIHRAAHELAARATDAYEGARGKVQRFINAASPNEIVFVRGTTEAINLVAKSWGEQFLNSGDEIIVSHLEHHANIVPWQQLAAKKGLKLRVIPVDDDGQLLLDEYAKLLNSKTKLVAFTQVSNALGTITPAKAIIEMAHAAGAKVLLDGAQSVSHLRADVQALNPDWFVFSGHKIFGPTGIGVLYGKEDLLNETEPWQGGGNMIADVTFEHTQYHKAPNRFEAGTGNIADAVGLGAALDYVSKIGIDLINQYEHALLHYATGLMKQVPGLRLIGTAAEKASVLSFTLEGYSNNEVGQELNKEGIAVRTGHHCAQPILRRFGVESTVRPSLAFYNTCAEVDTLVSVLHRLRKNKK